MPAAQDAARERKHVEKECVAGSTVEVSLPKFDPADYDEHEDAFLNMFVTQDWSTFGTVALCCVSHSFTTCVCEQ